MRSLHINERVDYCSGSRDSSIKIAPEHAHPADRCAREIRAILDRDTLRSRRLMRQALGGHEQPMRWNANARFSPVIAAARPPTRANQASDRHHGEGIPCLDRSSPGTPANAIPTECIRPPSWWERNRRERARAPSRGTHPTAITANRAEAERPRRLSQAAPSRAITSGRSARPSGVVPPNQRMQPDAVPATEIVPILCGIIIPNAIPIAGCGAADAPGVRRRHHLTTCRENGIMPMRYARGCIPL
jgi:hypothetical protein